MTGTESFQANAVMSALRRRVEERVIEVLIARGWEHDVTPEDPNGPLYRRLVRPLDGGFIGSVIFDELGTMMQHGGVTGKIDENGRRGPDQPPIRLEVLLTVESPRLRTTLRRLGSYFWGDIVRNIENLVDASTELRRIDYETDLASAITNLADLVDRVSVPFFEAHVSLYSIIDEWRTIGGQGEAEVVPAALAVSGKEADARREIAEYLDRDDPAIVTREYRRYARQLTRWIDAGGELPDEADEPEWDKSEPRASERLDFSEFRQRRREIHLAYESVKNAGAHLIREERHHLLEEEVERRGLSFPPLWYEKTLDQLDEKGSGVRATVEGVKAMIDLGKNIWNVFHGNLPHAPVWLEPPDQAAYPLDIHSDNMAAVLLDEDSTDFLREVHISAATHIGNIVLVDSWFSQEPAISGADVVVVRIGQRHVGRVIAPAVAHKYRNVIKVAMLRDELPYVTSRLSPIKHNTRYLLEIPIPSSSS